MNLADPRARVLEFLDHQGLLAPGEHAELSPLTGGVSSVLWRVELPGRTVAVKSALAQLKVAKQWLAPVSRNRVERDWLLFAVDVAPGQVPQVLASDDNAGLFAMEYLPPHHYPVWKSQLLAGHVDSGAAGAVGDLLGRLHAASATDPHAPTQFATDDNFDALRVEPYLRATARALPELADRFTALATELTDNRRAVVHGDVSPKNILLGPDGPVLLDAECAWFGDPAFDLAFCVNHLLLKAVHLPAHADALRDSAVELVAAHRVHQGWEPPHELEARVARLLPALALARVDGTSPVEYLDDDNRQVVRGLARPLMTDPGPSLEDVLESWVPAPPRRE